jgi:16S rRNA (cytosine1402-N4)-methyltransferase
MNHMAAEYHIPALLTQCMEGLCIKPDGVYVDVTLGAGGHAREILKQLGERGKLIALDQDEEVVRNLPEDERFIFERGNFRFLTNYLKYHRIEKVDGILADLGVSFNHFDSPERGFSFRFGEQKLDMRMNRKARLKASDVLENYTEAQLADVFYHYGELSNARRIATAIVKARRQTDITTAAGLTEAVEPLLKKEDVKKELSKLFLSIRIEVNDEITALRKFLSQCPEVLKPSGRIAVLSYHSIEDRLVKNFFKSGNFEGKVEQDFFGNRKTPFRLVNNKVIVPDESEIAANPRARSAKLRVAELR